MRATGTWIQVGLAAAGLVAAYVTWQRPPQDTDAEAVVLDLSRSDLQRVKYEDDRRVVEVVPSRGATWIRQTEKPAPPPAVTANSAAADGGVSAATDGGTAAGVPKTVAASGSPDGGAASSAVASIGSPVPTPEPKTREYRANDSADRLLEKFTPLRAVRALGSLPPEKLKEVGLAEAKRTVEIVTSSGTHRFKVASDIYGAATPYARSEDDGRVYVLRGTTLSDLEFAANRLVDRRLHSFREDEFDALVVRAGEKERRLVKVGDKLAAAPQQPADELATNWHERIWRTMGVDVLGRDETPAAGVPKVELRLEYLRGSTSVGFVEMGKAGSDVFARTEHTAGWVRLHGGSAQILDERDKVLDPRG